ncbi:MAG: O-antigen ligase family protein [Deltaproteobacteria bacterium]|nr:O-antigen ligase family protein [Deltaproteobacteria bacterium]
MNPDQLRSNNLERLAGWAEAAVMICLAALAALLPFADITASREIALWGGLFFWLVRMAASHRWRFIRTPLDLPLLVFALVAALSLLTAVDPAYSWRELRHEILKAVVIYYLAVNNLRTEARILVFVGALLAGAAVMDIYGVIHHLTHNPNLRLISLNASSPQLWTYLIQTAPFLIVAGLWLDKQWLRLGCVVLTILHILAAYWTGGRTPMLVLVIQLGLIFFFLGVRFRYIAVAALIMSLGLALFLPRQAIIIGDRSPSELNVAGVTIMGLKGTRLEVWGRAWEHIRAHPFSGLGFGRRSFNKQYPDLIDIDYHLWHPHNLFLGIATETGLQGLAAFCFLLISMFKTLWPRFPRGPGWLKSGPAASFAIAVFISTIGIIINDLTDYHLVGETALMFWLLAGAAVSIQPLHNRERSGKQQP